MNRISTMWNRKAGRKALVTFMTAGDPDIQTTSKLVLAMENGGSDLVELGVPFSDPMADGPVIQKSSERALLHNTSLKDVLAIVKEVRTTSQIPLLLMGYYNPILSYGLEKFAKDAKEAGVDAVLVVDLPPEESEDLDQELKKQGLDFVYLLTPTSDATRIKKVASRARGFIYFVSITGVTGGALIGEKEIRQKIAQIKKHTDLPIAIGFGISTPEQAQAMSQFADGVVVGSALVKLVESNSPEKLPEAVQKLTSQMAASIL